MTARLHSRRPKSNFIRVFGHALGSTDFALCLANMLLGKTLRLHRSISRNPSSLLLHFAFGLPDRSLHSIFH